MTRDSRPVTTPPVLSKNCGGKEGIFSMAADRPAACVHERVLEHVGPNGERRCADCSALIQRPTTAASVPRQSSYELAAMLIRNEQEPAEWAAAFQSCKFDTSDNPDYEGERYVVIVAKGEHADRLAEAYADGR